MPEKRPITLIAVVLLCVAASAQPPADFSGRWTLDAPTVNTTPAVPGTPAAAAVPGDMGSGWGATIVIAQDARQLKVEYPFYSRYDLQPPPTFVYPLDGTEGRSTAMIGRSGVLEGPASTTRSIYRKG